MQFTNNTTTIEINEDRLLNLIVDQRIVKLENIFSKMYQVPFTQISTAAFNAHLYLCFVNLKLSTSEIADVYDLSENELQRVLKACHTKMQVNKEYQMYLYKIHLQCLKTKIAA